MLNIAICDDQNVHCKITYNMIKQYEVQKDIKCNIEVYFTGEKLLNSKKKFDFIFMDIELKNENGMSISRKYSEKESGKIIILTSHAEEIAYGYKIKAYRFLVKPLVAENLFEALDSGIAELSADKKILVLDGKREIAIRISSIMYMEAGERNIGVRTEDKFYVLHKQISNIQSDLLGQEFYMTHRSYIVNLNYVEEMGKSEILLSNGEKIKISRLKYSDLKMKYYEFIRGKMKHDF